jgi:hypothetical protein
MCFFLAAPAAAALGTGLSAGAAGAAGLSATAAGATGLTAAAAAAPAAASFAIPAWMTTGLSIASAVGGLYAQQQQASAMAAYNKSQYNNQMTALRYNQASNNFSRVQEAQNLAEQQVVNNSAARRATATARVSAGEGGVSGLSVDALLADLAGRAGRDNMIASTNRDRRDFALQTDQFNNWATAASTINSLQTPKAPDYLGAALKIGTSIYDYQNPRIGDARRRRT